ncbi:MAG: sarcosine oxidase subunit delta [Roseiarcus sp.]|jgi:sarcosine oxidase subunit delta
MQLFPCPFCGTRDETEFRYLGEAGKVRPAGGVATPSADWSRYLYFQRNPRGRVAEIWTHATCGEMFRMERDNVTHAVYAGVSLRKESDR